MYARLYALEFLLSRTCTVARIMRYPTVRQTPSSRNTVFTYADTSFISRIADSVRARTFRQSPSSHRTFVVA